MQLSSKHITNLVHNCNDFFKTFIIMMNNDFHNNFLRKILAVSCEVCKGLKSEIHNM